ncbi:MAG TPA: 8-oxo-dGTP diphosphatase MutT [Verrucomicrobiales bacterium]|nr:8-oxo-dGTP diphosphatase MutT [Verrucomicrobiales bacterium]
MSSRRTSSSSTSVTDFPAPSTPVIEVAAGLVFREGRLLISRRPEGAHLAGMWEFPGGKLEPGESHQDCLARELLEELGIEVSVGELIEEIVHVYPEKTVRLRFFRCGLAANEPRPIGCAAVEWIGAEELDSYVFPPADARLLERLRADRSLWNPLQ